MNTIATINAYLQLAPSFIGLIAAIESLFPPRSGAAKLGMLNNIASTSVKMIVPDVDHTILTNLSSMLAVNVVGANNSTGAFKTTPITGTSA